MLIADRQPVGSPAARTILVKAIRVGLLGEWKTNSHDWMVAR
jgi:hypothetical protein